MPPKKIEPTRAVVNQLKRRPNVAAELSTYLETDDMRQLRIDLAAATQEMQTLQKEITRLNRMPWHLKRKLGPQESVNVRERKRKNDEELPKLKAKQKRIFEEFNPAGDYFWKSDTFGEGPPGAGGGGVAT